MITFLSTRSLYRKLPLFMAAATSLLLSCASAEEGATPRLLTTQNSERYTWKNVAVSGVGCWVTGIEIHPKAPHTTYVRTDVGGIYRWDSTGSRWLPLSNHFTYPEANYYGVESIALDPNAPDTIYMACGTYTDKGDGAVFKSTDQGGTWTKLGLRLPMGANQARRWGGERLAVSPQDGQVLLFGSRSNGLWRSIDGGKTWQQNTAVPVTSDNLGVSAVAFDPTSAGVAYAATSSKGVYQTTDSGATWKAIPGGPEAVRRIIVAADKSLWITHGNGVSKYKAGTWLNMQPSGKASAYCGIAVNPKNPQDVLVSDLDGNFKAPDGGRLFRTFDGGLTWKRLPAVHEVTVPWGYQFQIVNVSALAFNPVNTKQVWGVSWAGVLRTDNVEAETASFASVAAGHEETCINMLATPPAGPELLSAMLDVDGFVHDKGLDDYPSRRFGVKTGNWIGHTTSIAYQEKNPSQMLRMGTQGFNGRVPTIVVSSDAGASWSAVSSFPPDLLPLHGVISSTDPKNMIVMCNRNVSQSQSDWKPAPAEYPWQYTRDGGNTWQPCAGLPSDSAPTAWGIYGVKTRLVADPESGGTFTVFSQSDGKIYRSKDGGATFAHVNTAAGQLLPTYVNSHLKAQPGAPGRLWAGFTQDSAYSHASTRAPREGLYHSADGGAHWEKLVGVSSVVNFALGKAAPNTSLPTIYIYGRLDGDAIDKIYRSTDLGTNWKDITDPKNPVGNQPLAMEASRQTFGRVFIGTNGSGIFYGDANP